MQARDWQVFDGEGRRKYVTEGEMGRFLAAVQALPPEGCAFCTLMAFTGCRISEALGVTRSQLGEGTITLRTLKRRKRVFRVLQVPPALIEQLLALPVQPGAADRLWTAHRSTAFRWVKRAMRMAGIAGTPASPKGLRHAFGIRAAAKQVPPNLIQRWLGHASPETTAIYLDAVGAEERQFAARMW